MQLVRVDKLLLDQKRVRSRAKAQQLIEAGAVHYTFAGQNTLVNKASLRLPAETEFTISGSDIQRYVSRAGLKLEGALEKSNIDVEGLRALDIGQSTGGFTDCLIQNGCAHVVGVDVGHDQLVPSLRQHANVRCIEGVNARELSSGHVGEGFDLVVMDVSFISQTLILPRIPVLLKPGGRLISLVKPQFEVGPEGIGKGGIVKNTELYKCVEHNIRAQLSELQLCINMYFESSIQGSDGNREFFVVASAQSPG